MAEDLFITILMVFGAIFVFIIVVGLAVLSLLGWSVATVDAAGSAGDADQQR